MLDTKKKFITLIACAQILISVPAHALTAYGEQLAFKMCPNRDSSCIQNAINHIQEECNQKLELINRAKVSDREKLARTCSNYQKIMKICGRNIVKNARYDNLKRQHEQTLNGIQLEQMSSTLELGGILGDFAYSTLADIDKTQIIRSSKIGADAIVKKFIHGEELPIAIRDSMVKNLPVSSLGTVGNIQTWIELEQALQKAQKAWNIKPPSLPKKFHTQK